MQPYQAKCILIADDDPVTIQTISSLFEDAQQSYELLNASNGAMAYQIARQELPDLIIMDWEMPEMTGIEAIDLLRQHPETQHIPIIIATGRKTQSKDLEKALKTGAIDYIRKPFDRIEFLARAQVALRLAESYQREKQLMQTIIEHKNRELSAFAIQVVQKTQVLGDIAQELEDDSLNKKASKAIKRIIRENRQLDNSWEKFKMHFEEVHPDFFTSLSQRFASLSQNEQKLCAYTKMKLSIKEIAQLLSISAKSVEMARYRIKKKLNLVAEENLSNFIQRL